MTITSPSAGVTIVQPAKDNGVLQQAAGLPDNQFVLPDSITATNNGNLGFSSIATRLIAIRPREAGEETRYITSEDGGTTGTVNENFDSPPTGGMAYWISYVIEDAATVVGLSLLSKRTRDYGMSKPLIVGNGSDDSFFALLDGASMESDNKVDPTESTFSVLGAGRWDIGYEEAGAPVPGGYLIVTNEDTDDYGLAVADGGLINFYTMFVTSVQPTRTQLYSGSSANIDGFQIYKALTNSKFQSTGSIRNITMQGINDSAETFLVSPSLDLRGVLGINAYGFISDDLGPFDIYDYQSVGMTYDMRVSRVEQDWRFYNPIWGPDTDAAKINWTANTGTVSERYEFTLETKDPGGDALGDARIYAFDDWAADPANKDFQIITGSSDAQGDFYNSLIQREWINNPSAGSGSTHGPFDLRVLRYGQSPFETAFSLGVTGTTIGAYETVVTLVDDVGVGLSEAAADLVSGTVYEHGTGTAPGNLISFDAATIAFSAGDIVVGGSSGATGTVRDKTGGVAAGTIFLLDRSAISFIDGEDLNVVGAKNAEANLTSGTGGSDLDFHWEVRASNESLADMYSWQASKSAKASPDPWVLSMLKHRVDLFKRSGGDYWTENVEGEGVYISERGAGNVLYLTADNTWEWTPPSQFTLTLTALVTGSEVRIYDRIGYNDTGDELAGIESSAATFQYSYEHGGTDIPVIIVVFNLDYKPIWLHYDLTAADASLPQSQQTDRTYSNP